MSGAAIGISVLVCVETEGPDLGETHRETCEQLENLGVTFEFLYLVSSTSDRVIEQLRGLHEKDSTRVRVLRFGHAAGRAAMLTAGIEHASGELVLTLPARLEVEPDAIVDLYRAVQDGTDLAFASRSGRGSARAQSRLFNRMISRAAGSRFSDIASQTRVVRREVLQEIPLYGDFDRYLPVLAERLGFGVREVPAAHRPDPGARAVHAPRVYLWRAMDILSIFFLSRFTRRPLRLFGGIGSLFGLLGGAVVLYLGVDRLLGQPLADRPLLVLGVLLLGVGVQMLTIGLLGELILFFQASRLRDYRIAAIYEAKDPPLHPPEGEGEDRP